MGQMRLPQARKDAEDYQGTKMRDLIATIEGSWWDTLLYKGRLHALTPEGDWEVFDWDSLISDLEDSVEAAARPALQFSFRSSNAISNGTLLRDVVVKSFESAPNRELTISAKQIAKYRIAKADASKSFPSTSMSMHYDRMIISSINGVYVEYVNPRDIALKSLSKISSIATRQVSAAYGKIACASGDAGLRQLDLHLDGGLNLDESEGTELNSASCDACDWMYQNVSATSYRGASFMAKFKRTDEFFTPTEADPFSDADDASEIERIEFSGSESLTSNLDAGVPEKDSIAWGSHDKIYRVEGNMLESFRFTMSGKKPSLGAVELPGHADEIVSVKSALFGVVIEFDEQVVVVRSDGLFSKFEGEPVNISNFSRSRSYENQLHLIMDDRIEVVSFNSNFEDEDFYKKKFGSRAPNDWFG